MELSFKRILLAGIVAVGSLTLGSCEDNKEIETPEEDFYYVNYKVSGKMYFRIKSVSYNTESGAEYKDFKQANRLFETQIGPVKRGFNAAIHYEIFSGGNYDNSAVILVSKNNGPFAEKASGKNGASYKIDF